MIVLTVVGIGLIAFGSVVLLKFPDRPGGKIAWHGGEVSSVGAGLPLIALGVAVLVFSGVGTLDLSSLTTTSRDSRSPIPDDRTIALEEGAFDRDIISVDQPKAEPIEIHFTDLGQPLGTLVLLPFPTDGLFKIRDLVDAQGQQVTGFSNVGRPGGPRGRPTELGYTRNYLR